MQMTPTAPRGVEGLTNKNKKPIKKGTKDQIDIYPKKTCRWPTGMWKDAQCNSSLEKCKSKPQWDNTSYLLECIRVY